MLVRTYAWLVLLQRNGLINSTLLKLGMIDQPVTRERWLGASGHASTLNGQPAKVGQDVRAGDVVQQVGRDAVDSPKDAAAKMREAKDSKKPVLMKVYREGSTRFVAISPRAA